MTVTYENAKSAHGPDVIAYLVKRNRLRFKGETGQLECPALNRFDQRKRNTTVRAIWRWRDGGKAMIDDTPTFIDLLDACDIDLWELEGEVRFYIYTRGTGQVIDGVECCKNGHPYSEESLAVYSDGSRRCRQCARDSNARKKKRDREKYHRMKEAA